MDIRRFFSVNTRKRKSPEEETNFDTLKPRKKRRLLKKIEKSDESDSDIENLIKNVSNKQNNNSLSIKKLNIKTSQLSQQLSPKQNISNNENECNNSSNSYKKQTRTKKEKTSSKAKELFRDSKYDPLKDCQFNDKEDIPYKVVSDTFKKLESTTKRLEKIEIISCLFRSVMLLRPSELLYVVYLCSNEIAPPYEGLELGIGDQLILKSLCNSTGRSLKDIKKQLQNEGDIGIVAVKSRKKQKTMFKPKPLTVKNVFETLLKVANASGNKSQMQKQGHITRLFVSSCGDEVKYLCRHLQGKMRIGVNEQTVLAALGRACAFTPVLGKNNKNIINNSKILSASDMYNLEQEYSNNIKRSMSQVPNYNKLISSLISHGPLLINKYCCLTPGIPIKVMLAKPTKGVSEILERFKNMTFTLEYKYDGERAQIHILENGNVLIFSRNGENNTSKFPDLVNNVRSYMKNNISSAIIDSEVVAYDTKNNKILPFQQLTTRKRKDVKEEDIKVQVCIYAFDLLYLNGESLLSQTFKTRRNKLYNSFNQIDGKFAFAHHKDTNNPEEISEFLDSAVSQYCEGLMVKTLDIDATYEPSKRSHNWLKCKKDYLDGVGDTLDLVVMGAFYGTGKRVGNYGSYLLGVYNETDDEYESVCKCATGFSDEKLIDLTKKMNCYISNKKPIHYKTGMNCHIWFEPKQVWEAKCADLTISPVHFGGIGIIHEFKGIGLRFPRFIRERDDKQPFNATNSIQIVDMYNNQAQLLSN